VRGEGLKQEAFRLTALGVAGSVLIDFLAFVLIPHPFAFTFHEFYVDYQPWITLVYVAIYLSPWLAGYMLARKVPAHG
jgi:TctA family transporter